jgi:hypothetical protein
MFERTLSTVAEEVVSMAQRANHLAAEINARVYPLRPESFHERRQFMAAMLALFKFSESVSEIPSISNEPNT